MSAKHIGGMVTSIFFSSIFVPVNIYIFYLAYKVRLHLVCLLTFLLLIMRIAMTTVFIVQYVDAKKA